MPHPEPDPEAIAETRELWGYPPKRDQVFEEIFSGEEVAGDWTHALHIHEGAEQYLGSQQFLGLEGRFASVPGIDECKHEDREVFLIKAESLDSEGIRDAFWKEFLEASRVAIEMDNQR